MATWRGRSKETPSYLLSIGRCSVVLGGVMLSGGGVG